MAIDVKLQIAKMLQLAKQAGTPEEAANAAAFANQLMLKFKLGKIECLLAAHRAGNNKILESVVEDSVPLVATKRVQVWQSILSQGLATANDCRLFKNHRGLIIVGQPSDISNVRMLYDFCILQMWNMRPEDYNREQMASWYQGACSGICKKIKQSRVEVMATATTYGLVELKKTGERVDKFVEKNYNLKPGAASKASLDFEAYYQGLSDADRIALHKGDLS